MDPILYNAALGGLANFRRQEIMANNLANAATPGFRADLYQAQSMYVEGAAGSNNYAQAFTVQNANGVDFTQGSVIPTGRSMDIYGNENSWLALKGSNGQEAYAKAASMRVDANGLLVTSSGKQVLGGGGTPIAIPPARSIDIAPDGTITIIPQGGDTRSPTLIDRIKMVKLDKTAVFKNADGLFQLKAGGKVPVDANARLVSGALEGSNVQAVEQMVTMIHAGRDFESHMNLVSTIGENTQKLSQLLHD